MNSLFKIPNGRKILLIISLIALTISIALSSNNCALTRLPSALRSRIISQVYIQTESILKKISPSEDEGIFATPNINPKGNKVVFHGAVNGYSRIWKYSLEQDTTFAITGEDFVAVEPCYSWDGKYIAFAADRGIDQKREDMHNISNNILKMGQMYLGGNPKILNIYIMNSDGSDLRQLTTWKAVDMRPAFSPDGKHILFMSTKKSGTIKKRDLYTVPVTGDEEPTLVPNSEGANRPWYSLDGKWIYYWKEIDKRGTLCKMSADGMEWHPLEFDKGGIGSHGPFIDPSGEWLWFHSVRDKDDPINQIYKISVNGGEISSATPDGFEREHVAHATAAKNGNYTFDVLRVLKKK